MLPQKVNDEPCPGVLNAGDEDGVHLIFKPRQWNIFLKDEDPLREFLHGFLCTVLDNDCPFNIGFIYSQHFAAYISYCLL